MPGCIATGALSAAQCRSQTTYAVEAFSLTASVGAPDSAIATNIATAETSSAFVATGYNQVRACAAVAFAMQDSPAMVVF